GVSREAQQTDGFEQKERGVAEIEHDGERNRGQREEVAGHVLADRLPGGESRYRKEPCRTEPQRAEDRDRNAPERAEAALVHLRAADGRVDVAEAPVGRV